MGNLEKGKYDIVADVVKTSDRKNSYLFTDEPIGTINSTLAIRADDDRWSYGNITQLNRMGPMLAGISGGPFAGLLAGVIAGIDRLTLGGPTRYACLVGTLCIGLICGLLLKTFKKNVFRPWWGLLIGAVMELGHLSLVLLMVHPMSQALYIVKTVGVPFVSINAVGFALMLGLIGYTDKITHVCTS